MMLHHRTDYQAILLQAIISVRVSTKFAHVPFQRLLMVDVRVPSSPIGYYYETIRIVDQYIDCSTPKDSDYLISQIV
jgi:hypothetical protein